VPCRSNSGQRPLEFENLEERYKQELSENVALTGPKFRPHSLRKILHKLNSRLISLNYDPYVLENHNRKVHEPIQKKLDKFYDVKMQYSNRATPNDKRLSDLSSSQQKTSKVNAILFP